MSTTIRGFGEIALDLMELAEEEERELFRKEEWELPDWEGILAEYDATSDWSQR